MAKWAIKHKDGTYFRGWTGLGTPYFGGTHTNAERFTTKAEADSVRRNYRPRFIGSEFLFDDTEIVKLPIPDPI